MVLTGLKKAGADAFIYIGGNDTAGTQQILTDAAGGSMAFVHAPKTIDNDLVENDHTPGFISAGEFVAGALPVASISISAPCPASMSASSWAAMPASSPPPRPPGGSTTTAARI